MVRGIVPNQFDFIDHPVTLVRGIVVALNPSELFEIRQGTLHFRFRRLFLPVLTQIKSASILQGILRMRPPRIIGQDICYHVRVQCNNKEFRFGGQEDFNFYESILLHYSRKYGFKIYNYVLMHTHVHLIIDIVNNFTIDRVMRSVNQVFSFQYNRRKNRSGHLWMQPYKSSVINSEAYAFCCMRYLDRNPIRAGIVDHPADWRWGGYNYYAQGKANPIITPIPNYLELDTTAAKRQRKYQLFVEQVMPSEEVKDKEWIISRWPKASHY